MFAAEETDGMLCLRTEIMPACHNGERSVGERWKKQMKTRRISIRWKLMISISILSMLCCCAVGVFTYLRVSNMMIDEKKDAAMGLAKVAAGEIEGDTFDTITSEADPYFEEVINILNKYKQSDMIKYIYTMKLNEDILEFVVDSDEEDPAGVGEEYDWLDDMQPAFDGEACCDKELTSDEWGSYFSAYAPIFDKAGAVRGIVGCDIEIESINDALEKLKIALIMIVAVSIVICVFVAFLISIGMTRNMRVLYNKVAGLNGGNGDLTQKLDITSGDELEEIAMQFNRFIVQIQDLVRSVSDTAGILRQSSENVNQMADVSDDQIKKITDSLELLSEGMKETSDGANVISRTLEGVVKDIARLNDTAGNSSTRAAAIGSQAAASKEEIQSANQNALKVVEQFQEEIVQLSEKCQEVEKIDEIIDAILKLANSVKILAQNTYIEVGRAGEQGRGFAVIADNIDAMNDQISTFVKRIRESNNQIKDTVTELMEHSEKLAGYLKKDVMKDYGRFVKIGEEYSDNMEKVAELFAQFREATERSSRNISAIEKRVGEINQVIGEATVNISEVYGFSTDLKDEIDHIVVVADNNEKGSERMSKEIAKYKF